MSSRSDIGYILFKRLRDPYPICILNYKENIRKNVEKSQWDRTLNRYFSYLAEKFVSCFLKQPIWNKTNSLSAHAWPEVGF